MQDKIAKFKEWWFGLGGRERNALSVGSIAVSFFVIYQFLWLPYQTSVINLRKRITSDEQTLAWMQVANKEMAAAEKKVPSSSDVTTPVMLLAKIQRQIQQDNLDQYLKQLKQSSNDAIEMHFQKVSFDKLIAMLIKLIKEDKLTVTQMATLTTSPGLVNADVYIKL